MHKKLLFLEFNEFDLNFFFYGSKKYNFPLINKYFKDKKKLNTFTKDKEEGLNLDPWVQWVSVHTGKSSKKHKVSRLGQKLDKNIEQIWEKLSKNKINSTIWGAFNSSLNLKKNIDLFFPDPWSDHQNAHPQNFNSFLKLPRYYAQNYPKVNKFKTIYYACIFFIKILFSNIIFFLIKNIFQFFKIFMISGLRSFNLYFLLDLFSLLIIKNNISKKKSDFTIFAMNSFAHYQHNYWDEKKFDYVYFWYLNKMLNIIREIEKNFDSVIILNGFSQKKIKNEYHLRPKKPKSFLSDLNLKFYKIEPDMTSGAIVSFKNFKDKFNALDKLKNIKIYTYPFFDIHDFIKEKKFYYKFSLVSIRKLYSKNVLNKNNYKKFFKKPKKVSKFKNLNFKDKLLIDTILEKTEFIKSTSRHVSDGVLFYKNFNFPKNNLRSKKIENTKIFANILNHFKLK